MNDHEHNDGDDLLPRATDALRQTPVPESAPSEFVARVVAQMDESAAEPASATFPARLFAHGAMAKFVATTCSLLVLGAALLWIILAGGGANIALADVADQLDKVRTATWTQTVTIPGIEEPQAGKVMMLGPSRRRIETSQDMVMIFGETKALTLAAATKLAVVATFEDLPEDGMSKNWLDELRQKVHEAAGGSKDEVSELGRRKFEGRAAIGFRLRVGNAEMDVWADPKTALPIRVEGTSRLTEPAMQLVMSEFEYNVALDESLFSLEPPAGYAVQEIAMDASEPTEGDLVELLELYTSRQKDRLFPPSLDMIAIQKGMFADVMAKLQAKFGDWEKEPEKSQEVMASEEFKEVFELSKVLGRGLGFLETLPPEVDRHYAGEGVRLGTPDRPVLWFEIQGSENFRVIYADLSVREVAADAVRDFPATSDKE